MGAIKIDKEISQYLPQLSTKQKQVVLSVVKSFAATQQDWWEEISEEQQNAIDKSLNELKAGKVKSTNEVMAKYKKWQKK